MSLALTQVSVTSSATSLVTLSPGDTVTLQAATAATNVGTSSGVTTSTGFALAVGVPVTITLPQFEGAAAVTLYGITASSAAVSVAHQAEP